MGLTENVQNIYGAFSDIKDAIEDKGVTVPANTPVTEYAGLIEDIPTGGSGVIDAATDYSYMFASNKRLDIIGTQQLSSSHVTDMTYLCNSSTQLASVAYPIDMTSCTNASYMFYGCSNLTSVSLTNSANIQSANNMFDACRKLVFSEDDILDLSSCTSATAAFRYASADVAGSVLNIEFGSAVSGNEIFHNTGFAEINILSNTRFLSLYELFAASTSLVTVTGVNFTGITTSYSNTRQPFYNCTALVNLSFASGSTISTSVNFSTCTSLSTQSIWNILDALAVVTSSRTCTLPSGKMPSASELTARYGTDFDATTGKLKGWTLSPTPA